VLSELGSAASEPVVALRGEARLVPSLDTIELEGALGASRLEPGGVYLISGGFSGLGRELARHLAERWQARLILVGRPSPAAQPRRLETVERERFLSELEQSGFEVCAQFADVADEHALSAAIAEAVRRFGRIDGAFHAAGVAAQGLLAEKTRTSIERVLAPKLRGSELLLRLLAPHGTKFLVLFSSTLGLSGGPGQTEYSAANQYLAGFAEACSTPELELIAVHWDAWEQIGIAARKGLVRRAPPAVGAASPAPRRDALFDRQQALSPGAHRFEKRLSLADDWLLSEHRIQNDGVLPGTAYVSFAFAALRELGLGPTCELRELRFLGPCRVADGQERVLRLETTEHAEGWDLRFSVGPEQAESFELIATAHAPRANSALTGGSVSDDWASARQHAVPLDPSHLYRAVNESGIVAWGPRWDCVSELYRDGELVWGQLALASRFSGDLEHYSVHPALLDVATALATVGAPEGVYLPASYDRISLLSPLTGTLRSRVSRRPSAEPSELCCDVLLTNEAEQPLVVVEGFRLKHTPVPRQRARSIGIEPERGLLALENILCLRGFRQIVVSPRASGDLLRGTARPSQADSPRRTAVDDTEPRALSPEQVASVVSGIWRELLGLGHVDERASFFELGGHSLLALQLQLQIRQALGVHLPLRDFFRAATLAQLTALLVELVAAGTEPPAELGQALPKAPEQPFYPLTPAQRRVFFLQQLAPDSTEYNNPTLLRIRDRISESELRSAVARLIERHESLRTSYHVNDAEPVQRIHAQPAAEITSRTIEPAELEQAVHDAIRPFTLEHAPLVRVELLWLATDDVALIFDVHHIAADGLSMERLGQELLQLIEGRPLAALTARYRDYVAWLAAERSTAEHRARERYWLTCFAEPPAPLELPLDFARPKVTDRAAETVYFELDREQSATIRRYASERGVTPFLVLLGIYAAFLARLTGQEDFVIGTPTAGRRHPAVENVIGMFVSTLPLRSQPRHTLPFDEFLAALSEVTLAAQDNQDYPFEELIALLDLPRNVDRNPLFDVFFSFQDAGLLARGRRGPENTFDVRVDIPAARHAKFDFTLRVLDYTSHFACAFEYRRALFEPSTVARFQAYFLRITEQLLQSPQLTLGELELVLPEERATIERWNHTDAPFPAGTVLDRFRAQCRLTPDALAASDDTGMVSYAELERRSTALAAELTRHGLGPGRVAAVLLDRSITMTVALWAVLASGAAYLPLDPRYPDARLRLLLEDSEAALLLADDANWARAQSLNAPIPVGRASISDEPARPIPDADRGFRAASPTARDLAYVIYTSGSTGRPKGVLIEHGSLVNRLSWMQKQFPLTQSDVILQKTPYGFDVSVWELFLWVFSGASLHFLTPGAERDPSQIARAIGERKVTVLHFVPPMLGAFLEHVASAEDSGTLAHWPLKYVFASGEALTQKQAQAFNQTLRHGGARLINLYGPTEATIDVSYHEVSSSGVPRNIPIGRPIDNTGLFIVNAAGRLQPPRIPGELWITGVGLARGYLNRPELTTEKFVAHPCERGARAYRSGDQARWLDDGEIEFLGRIDQQIKLRGHRIETQEIEAALREIEGIQEAFVQLDLRGSARLVGYYVAELTLDEASVRRRLATLLPDYMVPSVLCRLDRFPLTASGKLDRRALPAPAERAAQPASQASTERERLIQTVFAELLPGAGAELGIDDDFFELGGDSIKAILLTARLRKYGLSLEVAEVFRKPTIRALAQHGDTSDSAGAHPESLPEYTPFSLLAARDRAQLADLGELALLQDAFPLPAMHEQVLAQNILAEKRGVACHCYELTLRGELDAPTLARAWHEVVARHEVLRSVFRWRRVSQPLQLVYRELELPLEFHDFSTLSPSEQRSREQAELARVRELGFKPHVAPLLRAVYVRREERAATLWLFVQNSLFDAWSAGVLARDLLNAYAAMRSGRAPSLPAAAPFGCFVRWLREQPEEAAARFWQAHLLRAPLPLSEPQPGLREATEGATRFGELELVLRSSHSERLRKLAQRLKLPLNVLIHAVWAACFVEPHAPADVLIGTVTSGRPAALPGVEELVGLFTNVLPLRLTFSRESTLREHLERVAAALLEVRAHEHSDLDAIARAARLRARDLQQLLHRRSLVFLNTPDFTPGTALPLALELRGAQAHLDVALRAYVTPGEELRWKLRFDRALTSERSARSLLARVQELSESLPSAHGTVQDWLFLDRSTLNDGLQP
jgi:amino acid adenylation domain-containing protein